MRPYVGLLGQVVGAVRVDERGAGPADVDLGGSDERGVRGAVTGCGACSDGLQIGAVHGRHRSDRELTGNQPPPGGDLRV